MMGALHPFPSPSRPDRGTVHVHGDRVDGFHVWQTSASEGSAGSFLGPFATGQEAMAAAFALNRDVYDGLCNVSVCEAAVRDACRDTGRVTLPGDF